MTIRPTETFYPWSPMKKQAYQISLSDEIAPTPGVFMEKVTNACLPPKSLLLVKGDGRGVVILCREGSLWITQEKDRTDYVLEAGEELVIRRKGKVVVQARTRACVGIRENENRKAGILWRKEGGEICNSLVGK